MNKNLTEGKPQVVLWKFTIPMFISVIFQQLYNIADSVIAGKFAGENALAAVGASYPITMIFMAIAIGSNIGCSVVISTLFGAKKYRELKTAVFTTIITSVILSFVLTAVGLLFNKGLMSLINTPENIFYDGAAYLKIYIGGFIFLFLYNISTGIFSALGDSKTPLYFLIGSSIVNVILDYIFVAIFSWGVLGVAWATFIAQGVACILAVIALGKRINKIKTEGKIKIFSVHMAKNIGKVAVPSILQQSFISVGNIFIQRIVNSYGSSVIAGYSAAIKLNTFAITSFTTLGNGISNFTAQNLGGKKYNRIKDGFKAALLLGFIIAIPFFVCYFFFGNQMVSIFMEKNSVEALNIGKTFLLVVSPFYFVIFIKLMADGVLRGSSAMKEFMISTFTDLILRVLLAFVLSRYYGETGIWISWPIGWTVSMIISMYFYFKINKSKVR